MVNMPCMHACVRAPVATLCMALEGIDVINYPGVQDKKVLRSAVASSGALFSTSFLTTYYNYDI